MKLPGRRRLGCKVRLTSEFIPSCKFADSKIDSVEVLVLSFFFIYVYNCNMEEAASRINIFDELSALG